MADKRTNDCFAIHNGISIFELRHGPSSGIKKKCHCYNSTTSTQMNKFIHLNNRYNESPQVKSTINV